MKKLLFITVSILILANCAQAQKKISELPVATTLSGTDKMVIVNSGSTKQMNASVLLGAVNDTADAVRAYVDDEIDNIAIGTDQVTDYSLYANDLEEGGATFIVTSGGPKIKTTTSAGDTIVKRVNIASMGDGDILSVKACFNGVGVGKMMVYNASGALVETMTTPTLDAYTYGYIEIEVLALTAGTFGVSQRIYSWNNYSSTFTNTKYYYTIYSYDGYPQITVRVKYNSTTIGFQCLWYAAEYKPLHPGYSNNVDTN